MQMLLLLKRDHCFPGFRTEIPIDLQRLTNAVGVQKELNRTNLRLCIALADVDHFMVSSVSPITDSPAAQDTCRLADTGSFRPRRRNLTAARRFFCAARGLR